MTIPKGPVVLLSGGMDSCLALYYHMNFDDDGSPLGLIFDYHQKHAKREVSSATNIARLMGIEFRIITGSYGNGIGNSALFNTLTNNPDIKTNVSHPDNKNLPSTFVPGRNLYFLLMAAILAMETGRHNILIGVSQVDYSGYPDCREEFLESAEETISLALDYNISIYSPFLIYTKEDEIKFAMDQIDVYPNIAKALGLSYSCYNGTSIPCGSCEACKLRSKGFAGAGIMDPAERATKGLPNDKFYKK